MNVRFPDSKLLEKGRDGHTVVRPSFQICEERVWLIGKEWKVWSGGGIYTAQETGLETSTTLFPILDFIGCYHHKFWHYSESTSKRKNTLP
jgi:hypothetical protein